MSRTLFVSARQGEMIAKVLADGSNIEDNNLSPNDKLSTLHVADAFRSIISHGVVCITECDAPAESRYHFTDEHPFTVITEEGEKKLGAGWLAISEEEYLRLREKEMT